MSTCSWCGILELAWKKIETTMKKIITILKKEWAEIFKHRAVILTVIFMPLVMAVIPLGIVYSMRGDTSLQELDAEIPEQFNAFCPQNLSPGECFQVYMVSQFMIMFMLVPMAVPATISSFSIVGEKKNRSLEPLLATPITTGELLSGKMLSAFIPSVAATFLAFGVFVLGTWILIPNRNLVVALVDARWILAVFVVGPLLAIATIDLTLMVSSRVNDPRTAEQISMVVIIPVLAAFFAQIAGLFVINKQIVLAVAVVMTVIDIALSYLTIKLFQREVILTKWK